MTEPGSSDLPVSFVPSALSTEEAARALRAADWAATLGEEHLSGLARHFRAFHVARGADLCAEGDPGLYMGVLVGGLLKVSKRDYYGNDRSFGLVEPGDTFGEMSFLDGHTRSASLRCAEDAELLVLTQQGYGSLVRDEPTLAVALLEQLCRALSARVRRLTDRAVQQLL
jgi:CRP-like cAMP-binding protein